MSKDPAINWYFDNWGGGTKTMSRHLKGCYIDLLDAQFHNGHLSLEEIKTVLGNDFAAWGALSKKFAVDNTGKYFNERLDHEIIKRQNFSKKQYENGVKGGRPKKPKQNPNINPNGTQTKPFYETEIETGIDDEKKIGGMGERWKTHPGADDFFDLTETENTLTVEFIFLIQRKQLTASAVNEFWKAFMINNFTGKTFYANRPECIQHFRNWLKIQNFGTDSKNTQRNATPAGGTSTARVQALKKWGRSEAAESG